MDDAPTPTSGRDGAPAREWESWVAQADPASLLVVIENRMSSLLQRSHAAEDVLQEALLHAWRSRDQVEWRGPRSFRSWLLSIIDNRIRDLVDRETAQKRGGTRKPLSLASLGAPAGSLSHDGGALLEPAGSTTPSRLAMYAEEAEVIRVCLEALPPELRDVVRLRLLEQMSIEEVAARVGIGVSAARHRLRKGAELYHAKLRAALASRTTSPTADGATPARRGDSPTSPRPDSPQTPL